MNHIHYTRRHVGRTIVALLLGLSLLIIHAPPVAAQVAQPITPTEELQQQALNSATAVIKQFTGIHLGNKFHEAPDWTDRELARIDPDQGGKWPSVLVFMSHQQLYDVNRYEPEDPEYALFPCRIKDVTVRLTNAYDYVKRTAAAGTKVVIRIWPSPGTIKSVPTTGTYCDSLNYRTPLDVAEEIVMIHDLNKSNGFTEFGFVPANEPNGEWFEDVPTPRITSPQAWTTMDAYFAEVYDTVAYLEGEREIRLFTPPMTQNKYAEGINWFSDNQDYCQPQSSLNPILPSFK